MNEFSEHTTGKLIFDVDDLTSKHRQQSTWKKHVIAFIDNPEFCDYYAWFIKRRFNLRFSTPISGLRGTHLTLVNDRLSDFPKAFHYKYEQVKEKYNGTEINIRYSLDTKTDGTHWWFRSRTDLGTQIREEIGLSPKPYFGYHITIGRISGKDQEIEHGKYIHQLIQKKLIL